MDSRFRESEATERVFVLFVISTNVFNEERSYFFAIKNVLRFLATLEMTF